MLVIDYYLGLGRCYHSVRVLQCVIEDQEMVACVKMIKDLDDHGLWGSEALAARGLQEISCLFRDEAHAVQLWANECNLRKGPTLL